MGNSPPTFEKLAEDFADALDAWAQEVRLALNGRPQKVLVHGLRVNQGNVSRWLSGREQIWKGGAALPGAGLTPGVVRILELPDARSARLTRLADQVDRLQQQLTAHGRDWRKRAGDHLQSLAGAAPGTAATPDAEPDNLVRPGTTDRRSTVQDGPGRSRRRGRVPKRAKTASTIVATLAVGGVLGAAIWNNDSSEGGATSAGEKAAGPESGATATPGTLEKGGLGEDSRCSTSFKGPEAVTWRVCALVEAERVSFALKLTNRSRAESIVVIRLEYARASAFHPCPKAPSPRSLSVPAGKTVITDTGQCALPREKTPAAYQGVGWVFAVNTNTASYELSPTANVYPDRVIWKPDLVEQSSAMSVSQAGRVTVL